MKFIHLLPIAALAAAAVSRAEDKPAAESQSGKKAEAPKKEGADAAWEEVEAAMKGSPGERPKTRDEAMAMMKKRILAVDAKGAAFCKAYPNDPRRWKVAANELMSKRARQQLGMKGMNEADETRLRKEILAAPDADEETKSTVSFAAAMDEEDDAKFKELAEAHKKAFPDYRRNGALDGRIKRMETQKALKEKPLELSFTAVDGTEVDLAKLRGKVVLIDFWATWCGPCMAEVPNVVKTYEKLHEKGFEIVGISLDNEEDKEKLLSTTKEKKMTWVQHFDGKGWKNELAQKYGINSIPAMWLVNKKGMVVNFNARGGLEANVEKLLAE
ncbi:MAG: redoxin domain-containing protein [Verrucomicrobiales bacterium]|nr:redoxin domain-containing protein [Verrucomicrobiales bacterium]